MGVGDFFLFIVTAFALVGATAFIRLITTPFWGTLVRFRANYTPKGLQLDEDGGAEAHVGPVVNSYFEMMARVRRIEGWSGFWKGYIPSTLHVLFISLFVGLWMYTDLKPLPRGGYSSPDVSSLKLAAYMIFVTLLGIPFTILTNRAITTPQLLPWFNVRYALRRLCTPAERSKPWLLYTTPGLLAAMSLELVYITLVFRLVAQLFLPADLVFGSYELKWWKIVLYLVIAGPISTVVLCPLEVLITRLSLQKLNGSSLGGGEDEDDAEGAMYAGADEDVIGLRSSEDAPYTGLRDCVTRMVDEEGWRALYRGWWVTMLGSVSGGFR